MEVCEEPELLHFVKRKTPFCKVPGKEPLEIPWPHPTTLEPIGPKSPDNVQELVVYLGNGNQSEPVASPGNKNQSETQHLTLPQKVTN